MGKAFIAVNAEVEAVQEALAGTSAGLVQMQRKTLSAIAQGARRKINAAIRLTTKRRTGELLKAYRYKVRKDASQANIFPKKTGKKGNIFAKVYTLNYGKEGTRWRARGFVQKGEAYAEEGGYEAAVNKLVQKELDKYWS